MKRILVALLLLPVFAEAQIITSIAGTGVSGYIGDGGDATSAKFNQPVFVKMNSSGWLFISDMGNNVIRKISPSGIISTFAGKGSAGFSGDNGPATAAELTNPGGVAFDKFGNTFIADWGNNRIRKVDAMGIITTVAGTTGGYSGDTGPATTAQLLMPTNLTFDAGGNMYIADHYNNVVRTINTAGIISTIAGNGFKAGMGSGSFTGDGGQATAAEFYFPFDVEFGASGNLYIVDEGNERIRKVNSLGIVSTVVGNGVAGYTGDNVPATTSALWSPTAIAVDKFGNMFIADDDNYRIRKVNTLGIITTIAGNGTSGLLGNGGPATAAELSYPEGVALDTCGNLYIADVGYNMVRKVVFNLSCLPESVKLIASTGVPMTIYPNPVTTSLTINFPDQITSVTITNLIGQTVYNNAYHGNEVQVDVSNLPSGIYLIRINGTEVKKFVKE